MIPAQTIEEVIAQLDDIISQSKNDNSPMGYFAALYRKVTIKVKEEIANDFFDDGDRMEKLDVVFANRYIEAYYSYQNGETITNSWLKAFDRSTKHWPIVLQHLLLGMNAHINLDLGIAADQISEPDTIDGLQNDFEKINEVLSSLVHSVEEDLSRIWPTLRIILKLAGRVDDYLIGFNMKIAREGAWKFAKQLSLCNPAQKSELIQNRDEKVSKVAKIIYRPGWAIGLILGIIRLGERGSVKDKIQELRD